MCALSLLSVFFDAQTSLDVQIISLSDVFISPLEDLSVPPVCLLSHLISLSSYFVTELLGTDLHRLLTSRPLEKQFIQYFLYQILVCFDNSYISFSYFFFQAGSQIRSFRRGRASRSREPVIRPDWIETLTSRRNQATSLSTRTVI